ncbi:MAG: membrane protein insertion efficiency factor YidD [Phycisphaeraceae bacterium]|nr:membrane protein insertion efficiency factor YidD [Phycisphaeraceae bacterium]
MLAGWIRGAVVAALVLLVRIYQATLGPFLGGRCRFVPSCSEYAIEAIRERGPVVGAYLAARRLLRCHPFGGSGFDPVPLAQHRCRATEVK